MKRIGIDARLTYYRHGGIAEYMRQLIAALAELDTTNEYHILHNFRTSENLITTQNFHRVNCITPCHNSHEAVALGAELLRLRLDLLHSPDFIPPRFGAKHHIITIHDLAFLLFQDIQTQESLDYYAGQIHRAVEQADHIIAVSASTKKDIMDLLNVPSEKITVTWEGIHPNYTVMDQAQVRAKLQAYPLPEDYILFVGTIEPRKNITKLLQAYRILKDRLPDIPKLVLIGQKGWLYEPSFRAIRDLKLTEDVIWVGGVPSEALPAIYNQARINILPSLYEGFGFPPLEAMACGTPTIVSDRGALKEISGNAALFINPDDAESIADVLEQLLVDSALADELVKRGLKHVKQFTWRATAEKTLRIYQQVLA